ncbi:hypothetical protein HK107_10025 [Parvularcula sp. ZS-1/3]|uniref:HlyD family efflux transporter periplasmic adaptor subunit n=1 Tax=Parvularcula mediterranea TaxID=2732508 RepID=A0A7Y3W5T0_9PROT|nr:hypothetical protein [Parvularcula mediterranea]NNU16657.1 hypothetical protein [Parvularcula mediterranea]
MEMVAERLEPDHVPVRKGSRWAIPIAVAPLLALILYLFIDGDVLLSDPAPAPAKEYYPAVAIVHVASESEGREVVMDGNVEAEREVALRVERDSQLISVDVRRSQKVRAGQPLCRVRPSGSQEMQVLFSPIEGVVSLIGGTGGSDLNSGAPCVTVFDPASMMAMGEFSPRYAEVIKPGNHVLLTIDGENFDSQIRIIYPSMDDKGLDNRQFEVALPEGVPINPGTVVGMKITTDQITPTLVPFGALVLHDEYGMAARTVSGDGPTGLVKTYAVTLVATGKDGFYVEGLPPKARLIVKDPAFPQPPEGERVRIGRMY